MAGSFLVTNLPNWYTLALRGSAVIVLAIAAAALAACGGDRELPATPTMAPRRRSCAGDGHPCHRSGCYRPRRRPPCPPVNPNPRR